MRQLFGAVFKARSFTVTQGEQYAIVKIIKERCYRFQSFEKQFDSLFYEPYTKARHKHTVTSAILSGFAPETLQIEGIEVKDLSYGLKGMLSQPELTNENGIFHIYSNGSDLKGKKIFERSKQYNADLTTYPIFFIIVVDVSNDGILHGVDVRMPNQEGTIVFKQSIYCASDLKIATA